MSFKVEISGLNQLLDKLKKHAGSELPYILAKTLNDTATEAKSALEHEMRDSFDRPTPYTLNSVYIKPASKYRLNDGAAVGIKDYAVKGNPADKYLRAEVFGGMRRLKRFEKALRTVGVLPSNMFIVPGSGAKIDQFGNMSAGQIVQILSYFKAFSEQGYKANTTDEKKEAMKRWSKKMGSKRVGVSYFVSNGGDLHQGIWARYRHAGGSAVKPVMMFVNRAGYEKRLDMGFAVQNSVAKTIEKNFKSAWDFAVARAR